jgi:hypothetical protein
MIALNKLNAVYASICLYGYNREPCSLTCICNNESYPDYNLNKAKFIRQCAMDIVQQGNLANVERCINELKLIEKKLQDKFGVPTLFTKNK